VDVGDGEDVDLDPDVGFKVSHKGPNPHQIRS
jgi:hypothetical protein